MVTRDMYARNHIKRIKMPHVSLFNHMNELMIKYPTTSQLRRFAKLPCDVLMPLLLILNTSISLIIVTNN